MIQLFFPQQNYGGFERIIFPDFDQGPDLKFLEELEDEYVMLSKFVIPADDLSNDPKLENEYNVRVERVESLLKEIDHFIDESNFIQFGSDLFQNISTVWREGNCESKKNIQLLAFPDGVLFDNQRQIFMNKSLLFAPKASSKVRQRKSTSTIAALEMV